MRNRAILLLILPVIVLLWLVGWSLYWIGSQGKPQEEENPEPQNDQNL